MNKKSATYICSVRVPHELWRRIAKCRQSIDVKPNFTQFCLAALETKLAEVEGKKR